MNKFNPDQYLKSVLQQRNQELGTTGKHTFTISVLTSEDTYSDVISIKNLTKEAARNLFDLVDENNAMKGNTQTGALQLKIQLLDEHNKELDMNMLPNLFTVFY